MKPSFLALFRRGKYYRHVLSFDKRERKEVERFVVAAVAFCLVHDSKFRRHFWEKVCRQAGDRELKETAPVAIEEENWSDLKITNGDCLAIVEFKAGAPLDAKQNPTKNDFLNETGYGREMLRQTQNIRRRRYTILGYAKQLKFRDGNLLRPQMQRRTEGIVCCQRSWSVLHDGFETNKQGIVEDLFDCLGTLNIEEFRLMKTKKIHVSRKKINAEAAKIVTVIEDIKRTFGLVGSYDSSVESEESWWLGSNIEGVTRAQAHAKNKKGLKELTGKSNWFGWFGFEAGESVPRRAVWLYCDDQSRAEKAKRFVRKAACHEVWESDLIITDHKFEGSDYDWFAKVFRQLGLSRTSRVAAG